MLFDQAKHERRAGDQEHHADDVVDRHERGVDAEGEADQNHFRESAGGEGEDQAGEGKPV